ncbi:MAG TPA: type I restriction-modification system subunit M N-terminal domain-containing protein [Acetobacteraceae bacterium]|nr:type I restriction-modification system subunit M N-terminal domain-containing protein [Acetobacteraceae bacterium]
MLRTEPGCTTELDYTEQTSWMLFLKYLDDLEQERAVRAELDGKRYAFIIEPAYRWSAWAAPKTPDGGFDHSNALTSPDLIDFVNGRLFPYLRGFRTRAPSPDTIEYKISEIFSEIGNKFRGGCSLRDALELVDALRFRSQAEKHELSALYEVKIRRMGNAGRNGGEYYTPRPLIRAMIRVVQPRVGERTYDDVAGAHILRQGEEEPRRCHRHHEHDPARHRQHDPARHRRSERRAYQYAGGERFRSSGEGPVRGAPGQSAVRR